MNFWPITQLRAAGFADVPNGSIAEPGTRWLAMANDSTAAVLHLRMVPKRRTRIWTVHIGWRCESVMRFALEAIEQDWPRGFEWLKEVGVATAPCLTHFHIAMRLPSFGVTFDEAVGRADLDALLAAVRDQKWSELSQSELLDLYTGGESPFGWSSANAAILAAEIAGLCDSMGKGARAFDDYVSMHRALIDTHMFSLGDGERWIASLHNRLQRH